MTRAERTEYMRNWRRNNPDKVQASIQKQCRKRSWNKKGWAVGTVTILGIRCRTELYNK